MSKPFKLPFEKAQGPGLKPAALGVYLEKRELQMPYRRANMENGRYRAWITQLTDDELKGFMKENREKMLYRLTLKTYGPQLDWTSYWRNALYDLELLYRKHGGTLDEGQLKEWEDEVKADQIYWQGKFDVAVNDFDQQQGKKTDEQASFHSDYY